ncbi:hypothetical protein PISL3812_07113 [Talaromyces islandicus]|uniref:Uncharacterized protein n=1 Tax=Talaromyces islandicus TaxID=28573 RepID=A0A0U1M3V7_TALIS|nr:hypothetical protein PISL3812_07113 [Talaromyces islandicus]
MASFVNTSLDILRRHKHNRRPRMHSRWGDVAITAPIDGAWSQYNNPHLKGKKLYGPGFVPGVATGGNKEVLLLDDGFSSDDGSEDEDEEEEEEQMEKEKEEKKKKRDSKTRRLTRILLPSNVNSPAKKVEEKPIEFEYKPVRPDYAQEVAEKRDLESRPHFRYVPASEAFFRELQDSTTKHAQREEDGCVKKHAIKRKPVPQQRSHSCDPYVVSDDIVVDSREAIPGTLPSNSTTIHRKPTTTSSRKHAHQKEPSDQTRGRTKPNQQKLDFQRSQSATVHRSRRRTMTLDMVGDQEDLW